MMKGPPGGPRVTRAVQIPILKARSLLKKVSVTTALPTYEALMKKAQNARHTAIDV